MSWRTSSTVGSRVARSGCSYSLIADGSLWRVGLHRDQLGDLVDARLLSDRDRPVVAEEPDPVVDRLLGIVLEAGLHAQEVVLQRLRQLGGLVGEQQRGEHAVGGQRGRGGRIERARRAREAE